MRVVWFYALQTQRVWFYTLHFTPFWISCVRDFTEKNVSENKLKFLKKLGKKYSVNSKNVWPWNWWYLLCFCTQVQLNPFSSFLWSNFAKEFILDIMTSWSNLPVMSRWSMRGHLVSRSIRPPLVTFGHCWISSLVKLGHLLAKIANPRSVNLWQPLTLTDSRLLCLFEFLDSNLMIVLSARSASISLWLSKLTRLMLVHNSGSQAKK